MWNCFHLVYPLLSQEQQNDWLEIEQSFYHKEVTKQGYEKLHRKLFTRVGLLIADKQNTPTSLQESYQGQTTQNILHRTHSEFRTKDECSKVKILFIYPPPPMPPTINKSTQPLTTSNVSTHPLNS